MTIQTATHAELLELQAELTHSYERICARSLSLDLTRGKPSTAQLDKSDGLDAALAGDCTLADGTDARNYGGLFGIPEARALGAEILGLTPEEVIVGGNSSLLLMYLYLDFAHRRGPSGPGSAWADEAAAAGGRVKFLCPVPGYDRHFTISEYLGIEMIPVDFASASGEAVEGPDMDQVEALVAADPLIKGIWCVPRYSNPTGHTYSDEVVRRMAKLPGLAGAGFRILWDDAYAVHHLVEKPRELLNVMTEAKQAGTAAGIVITTSTSKITWAGAGISFLASTPENLNAFKGHLEVMMIGPDKVNQLRHVRFLRNREGLAAHMREHRQILLPKFELALATLDAALGGKGMAEWSRPEGGYFISCDLRPGLAAKVVDLAGQAGVKLTPAGATFPYGRDPEDRNIRLAPTYPSIEELEEAMEVFVTCVQLASVEDQLSREA